MKKFLDSNGVTFLSGKYTDNETLQAIINAIDDTKVNKTDMLDMIYPVGSIYLSVNATSPGTFLGGTWERIKDTFLLAAGDSYAAGRTGGETTHTLTAAEMPAHKHTQLGANGSTENTSPIYQSYQDDGNVVVYDSNHKVIWTTATNDKATGENLYRQTEINKDGETGTVGSGTAHNNMPPYLAVYIWKRTK